MLASDHGFRLVRVRLRYFVTSLQACGAEGLRALASLQEGAVEAAQTHRSALAGQQGAQTVKISKAWQYITHPLSYHPIIGSFLGSSLRPHTLPSCMPSNIKDLAALHFIMHQARL
eukprot:scaffold301092_cov35-Prasinocladus_malaysianus.AAC.1